MNEFWSGGGNFLMAVVGFLVLGGALAYGTMRWSKQRQARRAGTIGHEPGPAPKRMEGRDDRPTAVDSTEMAKNAALRRPPG